MLFYFSKLFIRIIKYDMEEKITYYPPSRNKSQCILSNELIWIKSVLAQNPFREEKPNSLIGSIK